MLESISLFLMRADRRPNTLAWGLSSLFVLLLEPLEQPLTHAADSTIKKMLCNPHLLKMLESISLFLMRADRRPRHQLALFESRLP